MPAVQNANGLVCGINRGRIRRSENERDSTQNKFTSGKRQGGLVCSHHCDFIFSGSIFPRRFSICQHREIAFDLPCRRFRTDDDAIYCRRSLNSEQAARDRQGSWHLGQSRQHVITRKTGPSKRAGGS